MITRPQRVAPLPPEQWHPKISEELHRIKADGRLLNIVSTLAASSRLLRHWLPYASYLFDRSTVEPRHRELAILRVAWLCKAPYEWGGHVRTAERVGLTQDEISRVLRGPDAHGWSEPDWAVLVAVDELVRSYTVSDQTWVAMQAHFDQQTAVELVVTVGQYVATAMVANALGVQADPGDGAFPDPPA